MKIYEATNLDECDFTEIIMTEPTPKMVERSAKMNAELPLVAIPTYKRYHTQKTLHFLAKVGYPVDKIYLFVADTVEAALYATHVPKNLYAKIIVGVPGLAAQHNFITDFFDEGEIILHFDDDVKEIDTPNIPFLALVRYAILQLNVKNAGLFGVLPNDDARRYSDEMTTHLTHIIGCFFMSRNHKDIRITYTEKDDYERSILYFLRYGNVLRYRGAGIVTTYQKGVGGLQEEGRKERQEVSVVYLVGKYPGLCKRKDKKGCPDLLLNWRGKKVDCTLPA
jgi:hypothetical protein